MSGKRRPKPNNPEPDQPEIARSELSEPLNDGLEANAATEAEAAIAAAASDTFEQAADDLPGSDVMASEAAGEGETVEAPSQPAGKQERLQKILAQAGIASRRHAEELITQGRVQVNGKVVTELGTKADASRDHIRVDGKLLQGSERLRYFMLNKPKGFVTTVSDPEGRPTIMEFFSKTRERLYPVGRLDYLSEGLLLVTNDGELANKLTRAASGVEKTYLVKVSGQPAEEEIDRLREGVGIDRDKPGSGRVQTAPAQVRRIRQGDNPWYEVVLIEGRNRELRKMFEEIGHHVEKIRRVGYGPLILDLEPGKLRELEPKELEDLRKAADGKYRKPKSRDSRKRSAASEAQLPTVKPHWNRRGGDARSNRSPNRRPGRDQAPGFGARFGGGFDRTPDRGPSRADPRGLSRDPNRGPERGPSRDQDRSPARNERRGPAREEFRSDRQSRQTPQSAEGKSSFKKPAWKREDRGERAGGSRRPGGYARQDRGMRPIGNSQDDRTASNRERFPARPRFGNQDRGGPGKFNPKGGPRPSERSNPERRKHRPERPAAGPADTGFAGKRRLEIQPADETFGSRPGVPEFQDRRPFQPRSENRPPHPPSAGRFAGKDRSRPPFDRNRGQAANTGQGTSRPRPFDRDNGERPRFDRPKPAASGTSRGEFRPQRSDRSGPEAGPGGTRRPSGGPGGSGKPYGARPAGPRSGNRSAGRPGGRPGGKPGGGRPAARSFGRRPGGKPGGKPSGKKRS